jgi:hypothetical protein
MNTTIRIIIIAREYNLWAGDSSLCQFKWKQSKCEESKRWGCQFMKEVWEGIIDTKISIKYISACMKCSMEGIAGNN